MQKFTSSQLDKSLNDLLARCRLGSFEYENAKDQDDTLEIYSHLEALGYVFMQTGTDGGKEIMFAAGLTKKGLAFRNNGGFAEMDKAERSISLEKRKDRRAQILAAVLGRRSRGCIGLYYRVLST
jgi:hypothetical protein